MSSKSLVGIHWLSLIWLVAILILSAVSLYQTNKARATDDPTTELSKIYALNIALVVLVGIILMPLFWWTYRQSRIGFSANMVEVVF